MGAGEPERAAFRAISGARRRISNYKREKDLTSDVNRAFVSDNRVRSVNEGVPVKPFGKGSPESRNGSRARHSVLRQLATLETMTLEQLHEQWRDLYGGEPPHYRRRFLIKRLAYRIQELFYGGLSEAAKARLQQVARGDPVARVDGRVSGNPRSKADILPGTRFVRIWKDRRHEVLAHENGFEYDGRIFRSLSAVARDITGTRWNGRLFFGLKKGDDAGGRHA